MQLTLRRNTTGHFLRVLLLHNQNGAGGKVGLTAHSPDLRVAYIRDGDVRPTPVVLAPWDGEGHVSGGFREIDPAAMPGLYELALPDEVCLAGARRATVMVQAPGVNTLVIQLDLVAYDPYDQDRLGLDCLSREARHDVISRAFREVVPEIVEEFRGQPIRG